MGLLDGLREEVKGRRDERGLAEAEGKAAAALKEERLRPRMQSLYRYFKELADHLEVLAPNVAVQCDLPVFGTVSGLKQQDYRVWMTNPNDVSRFTFAYDCVSKTRVEHRLNDKVAEATRNTLRSNDIGCDLQSAGRGNSRVILHPCIPVSYEFESRR